MIVCKDHRLVGGWKLKNGNLLYICTSCGLHVEDGGKYGLSLQMLDAIHSLQILKWYIQYKRTRDME